jgi:transcriptional regulatory protein RtcR
VLTGQFREDLLARINLWTYELPPLKQRIEDFEPNLEHELQQFTARAGYKVSFNKAARAQYLAFAYSPEALWRANFRDLNSSVTRMATLATGGRITEDIVAAEIERLKQGWSGFIREKPSATEELTGILPAEALDELDLFDRMQLAEVVRVCRGSRSMAEAGRKLYNASRSLKASVNDSHRLKQYLQRFGLTFRSVSKAD